MTEQHKADEAASPATPAETPSLRSPGEMIREAREAAGRSAAELAESARLPQSIVTALECDDFETLKEPVYVRGYYRKCALMLDMDPEPVVRAYEAKARPAAPALPDKIPVVADGGAGTGRRILRLVLVLLLVLGLVLVGRWLLTAEPGTTGDGPLDLPSFGSATEEGATATATTPSVGESAEPLAAPDRRAADSGDAAEAPTGATGEPEAAAAAPDSDSDAPVPEAVAGEPVLELRFTDDSWLRVRDASGNRLENGLIEAGAQRRLREAPPLEVFIGYAPGVEVRWRGEVVDLADATRSNNTALVTLE